MKILARFPGNPTLEILIKIHNCVGSTNMRGRFLIKVRLFPIYNCPVILEYFLRWVYLIFVNLRNFNPRKIQFFVSFLCKTIFAAPTHRMRLVSKDVEFYCASFDRSEKFVASCPPMETPTQKLKNQFLSKGDPLISLGFLTMQWRTLGWKYESYWVRNCHCLKNKLAKKV